jgi:gas vesicle protein
MADENGGDNLIWFMAGAAVGAAVALLFAPKTGRELRRLISDKSAEGRDYVVETGRDIYGKGRELYERGKDLAEDAAELIERGRKVVRI